jgi:hypothetical protein
MDRQLVLILIVAVFVGLATIPARMAVFKYFKGDKTQGWIAAVSIAGLVAFALIHLYFAMVGR